MRIGAAIGMTSDMFRDFQDVFNAGLEENANTPVTATTYRCALTHLTVRCRNAIPTPTVNASTSKSGTTFSAWHHRSLMMCQSAMAKVYATLPRR